MKGIIQSDNDILDIEENKKKKSSLIISLLGALLVTIIFHIRMGLGVMGLMELMGPSWGYTVLLIAVFFASFVVMFVILKRVKSIKSELSDDEKKKKKEIRIDVIFLIIDIIMTGNFIYFNKEQLASTGILWAVAEVATFFAIVWFGFEFFHRFRFFPERIFRFVIGFFVQVCIPMLFLLIIMLGAYQSKYGYDDLFRDQIGINSEKFASVMQDAYYKLITTFYNIGQENPDLWIWLPVAALFIMTLWLLYRTFTKTEKKDEDKSAQEIIDESLREQLEEEDYEFGRKKRPMAYNFFHKIGEAMKGKKEREREAKEKEEDKYISGKIYDIKLIQMKRTEA